MATLDVSDVLHTKETLDEQLRPLYKALGTALEGGEHGLEYLRADLYLSHEHRTHAHLALHFMGQYGNRFDIHLTLPFYLVSADSEFDIDCCVAAVKANPDMIRDEHGAFFNQRTYTYDWPWEAP